MTIEILSCLCGDNVDLWLNSEHIYDIIIQVNKPEAAASLLDKAGKLLEKERPEDATGLYEKVSMIL